MYYTTNLRDISDYFYYKIKTIDFIFFFCPQVDVTFIAYLHDAMYLYLAILEDILRSGQNPRRGGDIFFEMAKRKIVYGNHGPLTRLVKLR